MGKKKKDKKRKKGYRPFDPMDLQTRVIEDPWEMSEEEKEAMKPPPVTRAQRIYFYWLVLWNAQTIVTRSNKVTISAHIDAALKERNRLGLPFRQGSIEERVMEMGGIVRAAMKEEEES